MKQAYICTKTILSPDLCAEADGAVCLPESGTNSLPVHIQVTDSGSMDTDPSVWGQDGTADPENPLQAQEGQEGPFTKEKQRLPNPMGAAGQTGQSWGCWEPPGRDGAGLGAAGLGQLGAICSCLRSRPSTRPV